MRRACKYEIYPNTEQTEQILRTVGCARFVYNNLTLSDRRWTCPHCGTELDRDVNAALNLREYFYGVVTEENYNTAGTAGIYASGDGSSTLRATLVQASSLKEEAPSFRWG